MTLLELLKELYLVSLIVAIVFFVMAAGLFVSTRILRHRLKRQRKETAAAKEQCERLGMEIVTLRGEIEAVRAISSPGEVIVPLRQSVDSVPRDAPLRLDDLLDPEIFETTMDGSELEVRPRTVSASAVTEYDSGKDVPRYTVKFDPEKNDWVLRKVGQTRAIRRFKNKQEAVEAARELARKAV